MISRNRKPARRLHDFARGRGRIDGERTPLHSAVRIALVLLITVLTSVALAAPDGLGASRKRLPKHHALSQQTAAPTGRIVVKFRDASKIRVIPGGVTSSDKAAADRVTVLMARAAPGAVTERRFDLPAVRLDAMRSAAETRSGRRLPDLNTYAVLDPGLGPDDRDALLAVVADLLTDPAVETAYLEPRYVPSSLGFDAFTGTYTPPDLDEPTHYTAPDATTSTDFSSQQGYLDPPPTGINALTTEALPGGRGQGVKVIDVELSWLWDHEDLPAPVFGSGEIIDDLDWRNHGTAVAGVIRGRDDDSGVRGIAPECEIGYSSIHTRSLAEAIVDAVDNIDAGDVILLELQSPGPYANGGSGDYGYLAVEYWQDNFDAILLATASGRVVVAAAGNGQQDLDDPVYAGLFDRDYRDSGAILVGAARPDLTPEFFTNYGQRLDVHAWGREVVTCGYGELQGLDEGLPEELWYTDLFSGTSSAAAIVAGVVADLQGLARAQMGFSLDPLVVREVLAATGTPYQSSHKHIGPRPDVAAAWALANMSVGNLSGRVSDSVTQLGIPDVRIRLPGLDRTVVTDRNGLYSLNLPPGELSLELDDYLYETAYRNVTVSPGQGQVMDIALEPLPLVTLSGLIAGTDTLLLADIRVSVPGRPIIPVWSHTDGGYNLPRLAAGKTVTVLFDGRPWHGAEALVITPEDTPSGFNRQDLRITPAVETFFTSGGFSPDPHWSWGHPVQGPDSGFSPHTCWGVGMSGDYLDNAYALLTSANYWFPDTDLLRLSFHYWCDTESSYDGVNLQYRHEGEWIRLEPMTGYTHDSVTALDAEPGWSGQIGEWRGAVFDLTDLDHYFARFRLVFGSDHAVSETGFFIDDIAFITDAHTVGVEMTPETPGLALSPELSAHPNPFNPRTRLDWRATRPGPVEIGIFDTRGRRVCTIHERAEAETAGRTVWAGRDDDGRALPSGVYLVRMRDAAGAEALGRVTLMK